MKVRRSVMNIEALFIADNPIPSHALAAILALFLGILQLTRKKGTIPHKYIGYAWVFLMLYVSASSFFIHELKIIGCLLYTSPSPRDATLSRMPSSA